MADERKRICLVIAGFPPFVGGGERHARLLGREWARAGHEVTVLTRRMKPEWSAKEEMDGMNLCRVSPAGANSWGKYAMIPFAAVWLWRRRREFDLVYVCAFRVLGWLGVWARLLGMRVWMRAEARGEWSGEFIWAGAGQTKPRPGLKAVARPYVALRNLCIRSADAFVSIGPDIRRELESGPFRPRRILDIPNGVDLDAFPEIDAQTRADARRELGWDDGAFVWATSGKLIRGKGLDDLLAAWERVSRASPRARLLLIGSGDGQPLSVEADLRATVEARGWTSTVRFTGFVPDVARWLAAADAFVFPSHKESFGLSPLEAMAVGLPVLATRSGGVESFIEEGRTGRLVDVGDPAALAGVMREWMETPEATRPLAEAGKQRARTRYSIGPVARRHLELLQNRQPQTGN